uniref:Uncharacterized protein n=1 Tax=Pseudo-nitzschia australis TaxID=44445 RepID=A0A7S4AHW4_9STRA
MDVSGSCSCIVAIVPFCYCRKQQRQQKLEQLLPGTPPKQKGRGKHHVAVVFGAIVTVNISKQVSQEEFGKDNNLVGYAVRFCSKKPPHKGRSIKFVTTDILLRRLIDDTTNTTNSKSDSGSNANNEDASSSSLL